MRPQTIQKREFIELKHEPRQKTDCDALTRVSLDRQAALLKQKLKQARGKKGSTDTVVIPALPPRSPAPS